MRTELAHHNLHLNTAAPDEHVPEIERFIRTIKERVRSTWNSLPFQQYPNVMIAYMVYSAIFWINTVPPADGISTSVSPRTIVSGLTIDYNIHCKIDFGAYAQVHEEHDNSMATRTVGAISLGTTGNAQGGCWFLSLITGRRLHRLAWTVLPMPAEVIDRVHTIARRDKANKLLTFTACDSTIIDDEEAEVGEDNDSDDSDDSDYNPDNDTESEDASTNSDVDSDKENDDDDDNDNNDDVGTDEDNVGIPGVDDNIAGVPDETAEVDNQEYVPENEDVVNPDGVPSATGNDDFNDNTT